MIVSPGISTSHWLKRVLPDTGTIRSHVTKKQNFEGAKDLRIRERTINTTPIKTIR